MKFPKTHKLKDIAAIIDAKYIGDENYPIEGINEIHRVEAGDIVFVDHPKYYDKALESAATIILINKEVECPEGKALLISDDPFRDFVKIGQYFLPFEPATKHISDTSEIGEDTLIQPGAFIGNHVKIGKNCLIHANVTINDHAIIGDNVIIRSGTVLGADAFYYKNRPTGFDRLKSVGNVIIEDNVEIGAGTTIDRATMGSTIIRNGVKLDNQIQIAHNVEIGENTVIAAQTGVAGSTKIGKHCTIGGQVGISGHIVIGNNVRIQAQSGVTKNLKDNDIIQGTPAFGYNDFSKSYVHFKNLPKIMVELNELRKINIKE